MINLPKQKLFSVLIPTFNNSQFLIECIDSVLMQDYQNIEIVISDDCSLAFDRERFKLYIEKNKRNNISNFIINENPINLGTVKNINTLIRLSNGDYIMNLGGDDTLYDNTALSTLANFLDNNTPLAVIGKLAYYNYVSKSIGDIYPRDFEANILKYEAPENMFRYIRSNFDCLPGSSFTYRRELVNKYGPYDESYRLSEDYPRYLDLLSKGVKIGFVDRIIVKYRFGVGVDTSINPQIVTQREKDLALVRAKEFVKLPY